MIIRSIIIDDEPNGRNTLALLLEKYCPTVEVAATADSSEAGIALIQEHRPDLVFLDIEMPLGSGFDVMEQFTDHRFEVVFTTAHTEYAVRTFRVNALDYLLKPIRPSDLEEAVRKATLRIHEHRMYNQQQSSEQLETLIGALAEKNTLSNRIGLRTADGVEFVQVQDIVRCESENCYTLFHFANGNRILVSRTLREFEDSLGPYNFLRVHNSHLVNITHIRRYVKSDGGYLIMSDGAEILLSRQRKDMLIRTIMEVLSGRV